MAEWTKAAVLSRFAWVNKGETGSRREEETPGEAGKTVTNVYGGVAEWTKAAVLKTVVPSGTVGSNPTSSASLYHYDTGKKV